MKEFKLIFNIEPVVKGRPRVCKWGAYTPKKTAEFEKELKALAKILWKKEPFSGPLKIRIRLICKKPKKPSQVWPRGDVDNFSKAVSDSLNEILWLDDCQIVDERTTKEYGDQGMIEITVEELQGPLVFEE